MGPTLVPRTPPDGESAPGTPEGDESYWEQRWQEKKLQERDSDDELEYHSEAVAATPASTTTEENLKAEAQALEVAIVPAIPKAPPKLLVESMEAGEAPLSARPKRQAPPLLACATHAGQWSGLVMDHLEPQLHAPPLPLTRSPRLMAASQAVHPPVLPKPAAPRLKAPPKAEPTEPQAMDGGVPGSGQGSRMSKQEVEHQATHLPQHISTDLAWQRVQVCIRNGTIPEHPEHEPRCKSALARLKELGDEQYDALYYQQAMLRHRYQTSEWTTLRDTMDATVWVKLLCDLDIDLQGAQHLFLLAQQGVPGRTAANKLLWEMLAPGALHGKWDPEKIWQAQIKTARLKIDQPPQNTRTMRHGTPMRP